MNITRARNAADARDQQPAWRVELAIYAMAVVIVAVALAITAGCAWLWGY
ncbi:MAG: hypothetical protein PHU85_02340 [Phycisphaerae bacterium]|nr:hypothetical protein [Phycisphaerae bacterium]